MAIPLARRLEQRTDAEIQRGQEIHDEALTPEEAKAIRALTSLAKRWPRSLTLFSNSGGLEVHHTKDFMQDPISSSPVADLYSLIPNDGGDRT
jgi:hypothetical protein